MDLHATEMIVNHALDREVDLALLSSKKIELAAQVSTQDILALNQKK